MSEGATDSLSLPSTISRRMEQPSTEAVASQTSMSTNLACGLAVESALAKLPAYTGARATTKDGITTINAGLSSRSDVEKATRHFDQSYVINDALDLVYTSELAPLATDIQFTSVSPSGKWRVHFRSIEKKDKGDQRIIEVVSASGGVVQELDVTDKHAGFLGGGTWGEASWNEDETALIYVAEQHPPHWDSKDKPFSAYEYYPIAGEQFYGVLRPNLFLLDLSDLDKVAVHQVTKTKETADPVWYSPAFAPSSKSGEYVLYATGLSLLKSGRRLGQIWCLNRPSAIYRITYTIGKEAQAHQISKDDRSARSARVLITKGATLLFYLSNRRGFEHNGCATLHCVDLSESASRDSDVLVDTVWEESDHKDGFPGLYLDALPKQSFMTVQGQDGQKVTYLALSSIWRAQNVLLTVRISDGLVQSHAGDDLESFSFLAADGFNRLVGVKSKLTAVPELAVGEAQLTKGELVFKWKALKAWNPTLPKDIAGQTPALCSSVIKLPGHEPTEIIIISPASLRKSQTSASVHKSAVFGEGKRAQGTPPLLLDLHGGPNGADSTGWNGTAFAYAAAGFTVALVNYPGSTGYGQKYIEKLSTDCGNIDVLACRAAQEHLVELGIADRALGKRLYIGGSHSGFIGAHLSARWPDMFDAVCLRNPVIDVPSCFATSDIQDWSAAQFNVPYPFDNPPSFVPDEHVLYLKQCSPSSYLTKLLAGKKEACMPPTLLELGDNDLRVPPNQGLAWYHALKGHGENVKLFMWLGNGHPLEKIWTRPKTFEAALSFFTEYAKFD